MEEYMLFKFASSVFHVWNQLLDICVFSSNHDILAYLFLLSMLFDIKLFMIVQLTMPNTYINSKTPHYMYSHPTSVKI